VLAFVAPPMIALPLMARRISAATIDSPNIVIPWMTPSLRLLTAARRPVSNPATYIAMIVSITAQIHMPTPIAMTGRACTWVRRRREDGGSEHAKHRPDRDKGEHPCPDCSPAVRLVPSFDVSDGNRVPVAIDSSGTLFGDTESGGAYGFSAVYEISGATP